MKKRNRPPRLRPKRCWSIAVPIYNVYLYVAAAKTLRDAILNLPDGFSRAVGGLNGDFGGNGLELRDDHGNFAICFRLDRLDRDAIAHETDHVQFDIWQWIEEEAPGKECRAYLAGWLTKEVCALLRRNRVAVLD